MDWIWSWHMNGVGSVNGNLYWYSNVLDDLHWIRLWHWYFHGHTHMLDDFNGIWSRNLIKWRWITQR